MNTTTSSGPALIDVHDMVVVHRAFRREFRILAELLRAVPAGDLARAAVVAEHARLALAGLSLHHGSEDDLLWPLLLERAAPSAELIGRMEAQHGEAESLITRIEPALARWEAEARPAAGEEVAVLMGELATTLLAHLDEEERSVLPLAARCLTQEEWASIGQAGVAKMTKAELPIMFGMVMEDATPEERRALLGGLPLPVRLLLRTWGARAYRRYVSRVRDGR
ncbi:hemerythrin HHE cation binding domain-containing protein [Actinocorallia herbida]|uniref:Hemerythrin HHE cation binding domain-containing protein n=1 Tax=Actinocorallia herbida TaxID=58109 RepID=A0A3N1CZ99_9ACTN|nr:hemerythrin domain-containing protein [Actinocorallia herbida]ROO86605.1 hemerythrin HHE cation binding domain-containing protein [Actinocorallia herbida]